MVAISSADQRYTQSTDETQRAAEYSRPLCLRVRQDTGPFGRTRLADYFMDRPCYLEREALCADNEEYLEEVGD